MLVIDENMFKLAKMQEALLKVSTSNRESNLNQYKKTVSEIDSKAFEDVLAEIKHMDGHNQTLEEELQFLEGIKRTYDQLFELQLGFKNNCERYGDTELQLSDLSRLNIVYIENRISAINGYLTNIKNIEDNKERLQKLNEQLIDEEKKKMALDAQLLTLDNTLRSNFGTVEGRCIVDGKLQYTSVADEYNKIGLDFDRLLADNTYLESILIHTEQEKNEVAEKVKVAEVCYNNMLTADSKQILNEINNDYLKIKYKLSMLKIVKLLSINSDGYKSFVDNRKSMLELIKFRLVCMESLGMRSSIDPFSRTKVKEQLEIVSSLTDNSQNIVVIRKNISELNSRTEEMLKQNNSYLMTLNDTKKLIEDKTRFTDIDISPVVSFDELLVKPIVSDNQVVKVRNIPVLFNMNIINQKTASVIKRVNQMMNNSTNEVRETEVAPELVIVPMAVSDELEVKALDEFESTELSVAGDLETSELVVPELEVFTEKDSEVVNSLGINDDLQSNVFSDRTEGTFDNFIDSYGESESNDSAFDIVPIILDDKIEEIQTFVPLSNDETVHDELTDELGISLPNVTEVSNFVDTNIQTLGNNDSSNIFEQKNESSDIFETVTPFEEPLLFGERMDDDIEENESVISSTDVDKAKVFDEAELPITIGDVAEEMPEVFWVTQDEKKEVSEEEPVDVLSFDDQITALLASENKDNSKARKRAA